MATNKFNKVLFLIFKTIAIAFLFYVSLPYLITPIYVFQKPEIFKGDSLYNPYHNLEKYQVLKGNFHYHSNTWGLLTDGRNSRNTPEIIKQKFEGFGYNVVGISDYMSINPKSHVPLYEHGMGVYKTHRLVMGSKKVIWRDFIPIHNIHNKQFLINELKTDSNMVALAHPSWNNAYSPSDIKLLNNYDCFEILNTNKESIALWDTALSAGKPVFLIADDDGHEIDNLDVTARIFTILYASSSQPNHIIEALKKGRTLGIHLRFDWNTDTLLRKNLHNKLILPETFNLKNDSLLISFKDTVSLIEFFGQNGKLLKSEAHTLKSDYTIKNSDTYVRTVITLRNGTQMFMNPIFKFSGDLSHHLKVEISLLKSILIISLYWIMFLFLTIIIYKPIIIQKLLHKKED